jgi:transketolase
MDILTILYHKYLKIDPKNPGWEDRDRMIISKGHIGVAHAPILADLGFYELDRIKDFNLTGSDFGIHLDSNKVPGVDCSTGSLGHGLSLAAGLGLASRLSGRNYKVYCLLGDGESNEGSVWEAAMAISHYKLTGVITLVDHNRLMMDGAVEDVMGLEPLEDKWKAVGFESRKINGLSDDELSDALDAALAAKDKPVVIICETVKGCGIDFMENDSKWHYGALNDENTAISLKSLDAHLAKRLGAL